MSSTLPDFDVLATMAQKDPAGLEALRRRLCEELIAAAPPRIQRRLRGLQFKIDAQRRLAKTPLQACIRISEMMHESFAELRAALYEFSGDQAPAALRSRPPQSTGSARILQFATTGRSSNK